MFMSAVVELLRGLTTWILQISLILPGDYYEHVLLDSVVPLD